MLGGDLLLDDYKFSVGNNRELFNIDPKPTTWTLAISTIFAMMSRCDSLQLDIHFHYGVINMTITAVLGLILNLVASALFIRTWRFNFGNNYADIVHDAFGHGSIIIRIVFIVSLVYSSILLMHHTKTTIHSIVIPRLGDGTILTSHPFIYYALCTAFSLPALFPKRFVDMNLYFILANIAEILVLATTIYFFAKDMKETGFNPQEKIQWFVKDFWETIHGFATWIVIFWIGPFICAISKYLKDTKQSTIMNVVYSSSFLAFIVNFAIPLLGHFHFYGSCDEEMITGFYDEKSAMTTVGQVGVLINALVTNAGYIFLASNELTQLFHKNDILFIKLWSYITIVLLNCLLLTYFEGRNELYFEIFGNISYLFFSLILPPILYLKAFKFREIWGFVSVFFLIFAIALSCCIIYVHVIE